MGISKIAIKRPIGVFVFIIVILVLGYISATRLGIDFLPDFTYPVCSVITSYPGVAPEEIEKMVTKPIEQAVSTVPNVKKVYSKSEEGVSVVTIEFNWGTNMDFAAQDVRDELDFTKRFLPKDIEKPIVFKFNPNLLPVITIGFYSKWRDLISLQEYVEDVVSPQLERLEGVAASFIFGEAKKEVSILLNREKMEEYGIPINYVISLLRMENIDTSAGKVESPYMEYLIRAKGEFKSIEQIENLVVSYRGQPIYLKDIAKIKYGMKEQTSYARTGDYHAIPLGIQKLSGANTVRVAERVKQKLKEIEKEAPPDIRYKVLMDQSEYIRDSINNLFSNLLEGGILAIIVVFLFLGSVRSTLVIALSIPISIIATLIPIYFQGFTINAMSLGGLAIATGMLVDNSIVVLENIFRHMQKGEEPDTAGEKGSNEVTSAITASTLTTICIFLPVAFIGGITSIIFKQLSWSVTYSLVFSLILAITLVPMLTTKMVRVSYKNQEEKGRFYKVREWYGKLLEKSLQNRGKILLVTLLVFILSLFLFSKVSKEFISESGERSFMIDLEMKKGTKLDVTDKVTKKVEDRVKKLPFVEHIGARVGVPEETAGFTAAFGGKDEGPNTSIVYVRLIPSKKRKGITTRDAMEITRKEIENVRGVTKTIRTVMQVLGTMGEEKLVIKIIGDDISTLLKLSDKVQKRIKDIPGVTDLYQSITLGRPYVEVHYDRDKLASFGLNAGMVGNILSSSFKGTVSSFYRTGDEEIDIKVRFDEKYRESIEDIKNLLIQTPLGAQIRLSDVAEVQYTLGPTKLERDNKRRFIKIAGNVAERPLGDVVEDIKRELSRMRFPSGYLVEFGGEYETMQETFRNLLFVLILAIFLVYMVMAAQFESLLNPFIIIFTIPLAIIGVVFAFLITGQTLSLLSYLGIIMLTGVAVNNAIVMVDFINQLKRGGMERKQAIIEGAKIRLRPVLMTSLTTIIAMLPLALGIGEGAETRQPMGISFIGGMTTSTFLTLIIIPLVYSILDPLGENIRAWGRRIFYKEEKI